MLLSRVIHVRIDIGSKGILSPIQARRVSLSGRLLLPLALSFSLKGRLTLYILLNVDAIIGVEFKDLDHEEI